MSWRSASDRSVPIVPRKLRMRSPMLILMINSKPSISQPGAPGSRLQDRLRELREQASTAERAVVSFKNKNEMIDAGGRTINEQQLAETQ